MSNAARLNIQVCYVTPEASKIRDIVVPPKTTVERAIHASGILQLCPDINLDICKVGVYSRVVPMHTVLADGDRIEIYRPVEAEAQKNARQRTKKG